MTSWGAQSPLFLESAACLAQVRARAIHERPARLPCPASKAVTLFGDRRPLPWAGDT